MKSEELVVRIGLVALLILIETCSPEDARQLPPEPRPDVSSELLPDNLQRTKRVIRETADELTDPEVRLIIRAARTTLRNMPKPR